MTDQLPASNNVYSTLSSPVDLRLAKRLLQEEFPDAKVWIYVGYKGTKTLHVRSDSADFEGYPSSQGRRPDYLFNGALAGKDADLAAKVSSIFQRFEGAGVRLRIEAYDYEGNLICEFPRSAG